MGEHIPGNLLNQGIMVALDFIPELLIRFMVGFLAILAYYLTQLLIFPYQLLQSGSHGILDGAIDFLSTFTRHRLSPLKINARH
jgi:hypothetical protein